MSDSDSDSESSEESVELEDDSPTLPRLCEGDVALDIDGPELQWLDVDDSDSGDETEEEWHNNASVADFDMDID